MKILLTGAAGFIGAAVADRLRDAGDEVVGVDLLIPAAHPADATTAPGTHRVDIRDAAALLPLLRGADVVCHQAAMVGAGVTVADLPSYASHNDLGTAVLLAAMHEAGVGRLVFASSMVVYGEGRYACPAHGPQSPGPRRREALDGGDFENHCTTCGRALDWLSVAEGTGLDPRSSYAASKVATEHYVAAWARQAPGAAVALRYHNVYGPGMPRDTPYSGVAALFRSAIEQGRPPEVFEDGGQMRDFVHVGDVARANLLALRRVMADPPDSYAAYNVCSGEPVPIGRVAELVARGTGSGLTPRVTGRYRLGDVRHVVASPELARTELGFAAQVRPDEGLPGFATAPLRG
ncbi:MAG: NAD-dependent epimerase/dehydratase family protein [Nocardioidaceae bacterium]